MPYVIEWERKAVKAFKHLPQDVQEKVEEAVTALGDEPRPDGVRKLKGELAGFYRIYVGRGYRVVYGIDDEAQLVVVEAVGPRGGIYG